MTMDTTTFLKHLDVIISETYGSAHFNTAWSAIVLKGDGDQRAIAGHVLANSTLGVGLWHLECFGELAVNDTRRTLINFVAEGGPALLVGDAAQACLAEFGDAERAAPYPPTIDNKTWLPVAELDPIEDEPDREDDHFSLGCPSRA